MDTMDILQADAHRWAVNCFGAGVVEDRRERGCRFVEEALELAQAIGCTAADGHALVDYVFGRRPGEIPQEVGGVMMTLAVLAYELGLSLRAAMHAELIRNTGNIEAIRAKQASKVHPGPLPGAHVAAVQRAAEAVISDPVHREVLRAVLEPVPGGAAAGVAFMFKQWGEWGDTCFGPQPRTIWAHLDGRTVESQGEAAVAGGTWTGMFRVGKAAAGRLLDGVEHNGFPE